MKELPKGLRIDKGYLQLRLFSEGRTLTEHFGPDSAEARNIAITSLNDWRRKLLLWKAKLLPKHPFEKEVEIVSRKFSDVADIYFTHWTQERDGAGNLRHSPTAQYDCKRFLDKSLRPFFGKMVFDSIRPVDIQAWRNERLKHLLGTSVNREQNVLSSLFSHIEKWVKTEKIKPFKLPTDPQTNQVWNPCEYVERASTRKRERIVTSYELAKLLNAARELGDENGRDNIALAVKTCLSLKDLKKLNLGDKVELSRSKTGVAVALPIVVMHQPDWTRWRQRWDAIREKAGLMDVEFRDLRKAGGNLLLGRHDIKLISQYLGHAEQKTTESFYTKVHLDKMFALAEDLNNIVDSL